MKTRDFLFFKLRNETTVLFVVNLQCFTHNHQEVELVQHIVRAYAQALLN